MSETVLGKGAYQDAHGEGIGLLRDVPVPDILWWHIRRGTDDLLGGSVGLGARAVLAVVVAELVAVLANSAKVSDLSDGLVVGLVAGVPVDQHIGGLDVPMDKRWRL